MTRSFLISRVPALAGLFLVATALSACFGEPATEGGAPEAERAVLVAPQVTGLGPASNGGLVLSGLARPGDRVRVTDSAGRAVGVTANADGAFAVSLPAPERAEILQVTVLRPEGAAVADGFVFAPPGGRGAAVLRPGAAAAPLDPAAGLIAALDRDDGGSLALAGRGAADQPVRISVDGAPAGETRTDAEGRFALRLDVRVAPGPRRVRVETPAGAAERTIELIDSTGRRGLEGAPIEGGWSVRWPLPGGGGQTTYLFLRDPA